MLQRMMDVLETEFGEIAYQAIATAERVDCSLEEFRSGLMIMEAVIRERIAQVTEELDSRDEREDLDA